MRRTDWAENLATLISEWQRYPFSWGQHDCAQWALAVLRAVSARDWSQMNVQPYHTATGARRYLRKLECSDMADLADKLIGPRCEAQQLQRGDLAAVPTPCGPALGVCTGAYIALMSPLGLIYLPLAAASAGWKI